MSQPAFDGPPRPRVQHSGRHTSRKVAQCSRCAKAGERSGEMLHCPQLGRMVNITDKCDFFRGR